MELSGLVSQVKEFFLISLFVAALALAFSKQKSRLLLKTGGPSAQSVFKLVFRIQKEQIHTIHTNTLIVPL